MLFFNKTRWFNSNKNKIYNKISFFIHSSALLGSVQCAPLDRREVPSVIIEYEDDKENMPNESDYEDLPSMYKDEEDDVDDDEEDDEDDDSIFTSERGCSLYCSSF